MESSLCTNVGKAFEKAKLKELQGVFIIIYFDWSHY
jgi:hypothetical protein